MAEGKPAYAAVMNRAFNDRRLTDGELRILGVILSYDRLSRVRGQGQGAWASQKKMAARIGVNHTHFSATVSKLVKLGYLVQERRASPYGSQFTYRGVYTDADWDAYREETFALQQTGVCPTANHSTKPVCPSAKNPAKTVCRGRGLSVGNHSESPEQYISQRESTNSAKAEQSYAETRQTADSKHNPAETARLTAQSASSNVSKFSEVTDNEVDDYLVELARLRRLRENPDNPDSESPKKGFQS